MHVRKYFVHYVKYLVAPPGGVSCCLVGSLFAKVTQLNPVQFCFDKQRELWRFSFQCSTMTQCSVY